MVASCQLVQFLIWSMSQRSGFMDMFVRGREKQIETRFLVRVGIMVKKRPSDEFRISPQDERVSKSIACE
jgi:hypothetical protein